MIAPLEIPGAWMWSAWQPDRGMAFNSYLFERDGGFVCIDPLPLDDASLDAIAAMGRIHTIVLTNRDHERATQALVAPSAGSAPADRSDGDANNSGWRPMR